MKDKILSIIVKAEDKAGGVIDSVGSKIESLGSKAMDAAGKLAKAGAIAGALAISTGITLSTQAAFQQVDAVQQATVALGAYEKNGDKVNQTLSQLVQYARSDMGVLFQRQDLFAAAQGLKIMGDNTDYLVDHVKIMSRSVGLGLSTFESLGNVIQRVGSTHRLYADDLQFLQNAGFKLDNTLSGTTQTFESLFALLDKGIPADAMAGQSNTIQGKMVKLQSAFRDVGSAILGVDKDTSTFIAGGLGARFVNAMDNARVALKAIAPFIATFISESISKFDEWSQAIARVGQQVADYLSPKVMALWQTIEQNLLPVLMRLWKEVLEPLMPVIGVLLVGAIGMAIDSLKFVIDMFSGLIKAILDGNPIIWGLIGLFGTLAAAMAFNAIFNALSVGFATLQLVTIPNVMASIGALQALIAAPIVMPAIAIAAALAAIAMVWSEYNKMKAAIEEAEASQKAMEASNASAINQMKELARSGDAGQQARAKSTLHKMGIPGYSDGGFTGRGASNEIAGVVHKGEYVIPQSDVDQSTGKPKTSGMGGSKFYMYGNINLSSADAVDRFFERLDSQKEMGALGVGV